MNHQELVHKQKRSRAASEAINAMHVLESEQSAAWATLQDTTSCSLRTLNSYADRLRRTAVIIDQTIEALTERPPVITVPGAPLFLDWINTRCERIERRFMTPTRPLYEAYNRFAGETCEWEAFLDLLEGADIEVHGRRAYDRNTHGATVGGVRLRKIVETAEDAA